MSAPAHQSARRAPAFTRRLADPALALLAVLAMLALPAAVAGAATPASTPASAPAQTERRVVTQSSELPRRAFTLPALPSELLRGELARVLSLGDALERAYDADARELDIRDPATLRERENTRIALAQLRGDWAAVRRHVQRVREWQDKPGPRVVSGLMAELVAEQRLGSHDNAWLRAAVQRRVEAMPWQDAGEALRELRSQLELYNPAVIQGAFEQQFDVVARNSKLEVPQALAAMIIAARAQLEILPSRRADMVAGLAAVIDARAVATAVPDAWTPRQVRLDAAERGTPVTVTIWDSGVDLSLFRAADKPGFSLGMDGSVGSLQILPLGDAQSRWPQLRELLVGAFDLRAGLDTPAARTLRARVAALQPQQVNAFREDLNLTMGHVHGTHVAGIAVQGNPFARVQSLTMLFDTQVAPPRVTEEQVRRRAQNYQRAVDHMKASGARVVNMSWGLSPALFEAMFNYHGIGGTPEQRKAEAARWFAIEREALQRAIASAPGILFVAASGNDDNSADFVQFIPSGLSLPNLLTVGATDSAGRVASFTTVGKTVTLFAKGAEVTSLLPGGDRAQLSGTSLSAPQVTNLAAKLLAMKPGLDVPELKRLIVEGAERRGEVLWIDPKRSFELAGLKRRAP